MSARLPKEPKFLIASGGDQSVAHHAGVGRPSKYRPEYCDIVESLGRKGKSIAEMAAILNVDRASLYRWADSHDDFAQSLARAKTFEQAWWEEEARRNLSVPGFQVKLWRRIMAARFKGDYARRKSHGVRTTSG